MKNVFHAILSLGLCLTLTACPDKEPGSFTGMKFDNIEDANAAVLNLKINCESDCPEAVGGLASVYTTYEVESGYLNKYYNISVCSQTLIAPDEVLTNWHCLPETKTTAGQSCEEITVMFPSINGKTAVRVGCDYIKKASNPLPKYSNGDYKVHNYDWAILKLKKPINRKPMLTSIEGIPNNSKNKAFPVYYYKVEPSNTGEKGVAFGTIKALTCTSHQNSVRSPFFNHKHSPLFSSNCSSNLIVGNSGSAYINSKNKIVGVLNQSFDEDRNFTFGLMGKSHQTGNNFSGGNNLHCISAFNKSPSPHCAFDSEDELAFTWGNFLTFFNSLSISEYQHLAMREILESDARVEWAESTDWDLLNWFTPRRGALLYGHSGATFSTLNLGLVKMETPQKIKCIHRSITKDDSIEIQFPYFNFETDRLSVNKKNNTFHLEATLKNIPVKLTYDSEQNRYLGGPINPPEEEITAYLKLYSEQTDASLGCVFSETEKGCADYYAKREEIESFFSQTNTPKEQFNQFDTFRYDKDEKDKVEAHQEVYPACEDI